MAETISKVIYGGEVLMDLTSDTVDAEHLLSGVTAHDKSGAAITGTCAFDVNSGDATAAAAEILVGKTAYARGALVTGSMPNRGAVSETITTKAQTITITNGYHDGSGTVSIAVAEQNKIVPGNILQGITILGVTGTAEPSSAVKVQAKTVTPSAVQQIITPDANIDYLSQVTVKAIPYTETANSAGGTTVTIA